MVPLHRILNSILVSDPEPECAAQPVFTERDQRFGFSLCDSNKLARWEMQDPLDLLWQCKGWFTDDVLEVQKAHWGTSHVPRFVPNDIKAFFFFPPIHSGTSPK